MSDTRPKLAAIHEAVQGLNPAPDAWLKTPQVFMVDPDKPRLSVVVPALLAAIDAVLALHIPHHKSHGRRRGINAPWFCCGAVQIGAISMDDCQACGELMPCPTVRAITEHIDVEPPR